MNYPIRKKNESEKIRLEKIKRLRSIETQIYNVLQKIPDAEKAEDAQEKTDPGQNKAAFEPSDEKQALLYNPFTLTTKERRITQIHIILDCIEDIKLKFNERFRDMSKLKHDEITKIEEKNERISVILKELGISEDVYHPELDQDEQPENIVTV